MLSKHNPFFREKLLNFTSIFNEEKPISHLLGEFCLDFVINRKFGHFHFKRFQIELNGGKWFLYFGPFDLPIFNLTKKIHRLLSSKLLLLGFDFLKSIITFFSLVLKVLSLFETLVIKSLFLIFENIIHFMRCNLKVIPSFEHISRMISIPHQSLNILIFILYFLYFALDLLFLHFYIIILLYCLVT
jgi:hypothetical protein